MNDSRPEDSDSASDKTGMAFKTPLASPRRLDFSGHSGLPHTDATRLVQQEDTSPPRGLLQKSSLFSRINTTPVKLVSRATQQSDHDKASRYVKRLHDLLGVVNMAEIPKKN